MAENQDVPALQPLPRWLVSAVVAGVLVVCGGLFLWLWSWLDSNSLSSNEHVTAMLDVGKIVLSVAAGGGALVAMGLAVRRQRTTEHDLADRRAAQLHTERDAEARRITDLYTKSADQLGSDKAAVRLAGLYALERLAQDNPSQRETIVSVLCAYLRMPYTLPGRPPAGIVDATLKEQEAIYQARAQEREVRLTAQRILHTHLQPYLMDTFPPFWEVWAVDLSGATLIDFDFRHTEINSIDFRSAQFYGKTRFDHAKFGSAGFSGAVFFGPTSFDDTRFEFEVTAFAADAGALAWIRLDIPNARTTYPPGYLVRPTTDHPPSVTDGEWGHLVWAK